MNAMPTDSPCVWHWLWLTDSGLALRVGIGVAIFVVLAVVDLARKGRRATRWKEYLFLFTATAVVMLYGLANDMVTATISPRYFLEHEALPLDTPSVRPVAAAVALRATWTAGLIFGVALLLANNPSERLPRLPYRRMYAKLLYPALPAAMLAFLLGLASWGGCFDAILKAIGLLGPRSLKCVFCAHIGAGIGGFLGGLAAVLAVVRERWRLANVLHAHPH